MGGLKKSQMTLGVAKVLCAEIAVHLGVDLAAVFWARFGGPFGGGVWLWRRPSDEACIGSVAPDRPFAHSCFGVVKKVPSIMLVRIDGVASDETSNWIDRKTRSRQSSRRNSFGSKNEIAHTVEAELGKAMGNYGYEIVQTLIVDIIPDHTVKQAMNEINAAAMLRVAASQKAEAEKILQVKQAEAEAESKYLSGLGIARQRQAIVDGLRESVLGFSNNVPGTSARDVIDMVLLTQYFDTMKDIGAHAKSSAVFIPHGPGAVGDVAQQIRNGWLQGQAGSYNV